MFFLIAALAAPDVFFISVDTLRADHLGCYGYPSDISPHIDALAAQGLVFEDAVCEIPLTSPSFGAMLTSRYPRSTGTLRNGLAMPQDVPLLAEQFQKAGYQTHCVQSNWTLKDDLFAIARGFDTYDDDFHHKRWGFIKPERRAEEVAKRSLKALAHRDPDRPLFMWIHFSDPHAPYRFHRKFAPSGKPRMGETPQETTVSRYDSEVAYADHHLGRVLKEIDRDAVVMLVSDHGESLYEHGYLGHGRRIYQPGLHIAFIIRAPNIEPGRSAAPVRGVDVAPTLLGLAGLNPMPQMEGLDLLNGSVASDRERVVETYGGAVPDVPVLSDLMASRPAMRQGVLLKGWKLILNEDKPELFYLPDDPKELVDRADAEPVRVQELTALIEAWDARIAAGTSLESDLRREDMEALRSLGYVE
jgi:arylsulfatase A-like enzyme